MALTHHTSIALAGLPSQWDHLVLGMGKGKASQHDRCQVNSSCREKPCPIILTCGLADSVVLVLTVPGTALSGAQESSISPSLTHTEQQLSPHWLSDEG